MKVGLIALIRLNEQAVVGELVCSNQHAVNHAMTSRPGTLSKFLVSTPLITQSSLDQQVFVTVTGKRKHSRLIQGLIPGVNVVMRNASYMLLEHGSLALILWRKFTFGIL